MKTTIDITKQSEGHDAVLDLSIPGSEQNHISALCCNECGDDKLAPEEGELGWFRCNCGILHTV
jgi:hypothetical protein|tara:strand:- start:652 stop:843 length:192 start_codon:yes stop_codon:yes gene_type:complete